MNAIILLSLLFGFVAVDSHPSDEPKHQALHVQSGHVDAVKDGQGNEVFDNHSEE